MKRFNDYRMRLVLIGVLAVMMFINGRARATIIMSEPANVGPVINDATGVQACDFSHDGLELYFAAYNRPSGIGSGDIWVAKREKLDSPWQEPVKLGPNVNSPWNEVEPSISSDGLELYFASWDDYILRVCTRPSKDATWSSPVKIGPPVCSVEPAMEVGSNDAWAPDISADGLSLYFTSTRIGGHGKGDIWMATRATTADPWTEPVNLGPNVNTANDDWSPCISSDGLTLVFSRETNSMWATTRKSIDDDWEPAVQIVIKNAKGRFHGPALSPDGSTLYFDATNQWGGYGGNDFWKVEFIPIVDLNGDGIVDSLDMYIIGENWHMNSTLCDIAPLPLGDGFVDIQDLIILSDYLFPGLAAHWKLDELSGEIAYSSTGENDGTLNGNPIWQPGGGKCAGVLEFDGIDDYISTPSILNLSYGSLSVFAWINGGLPGQVIISQTGAFGETWLSIDPSGKLMTKFSGIYFGDLISETIITDGQWHHVGFVYDIDSFHRLLYVDGVLVAEDATVVSGMPSDGGMHIGASKDLDMTSFFSGLIDDVRIYNVALNAEEIAALAQ